MSSPTVPVPLMPFRGLLKSSKDPAGDASRTPDVRSKRRSLVETLRKVVDRVSAAASSSEAGGEAVAEEPQTATASGQPRTHARVLTKQKTKSRRGRSWISRRRTPSSVPLEAQNEADAAAVQEEVVPEPEPVVLDEADLRLLFAGAPHFSLAVSSAGEFVPRISFPFDAETGRDRDLAELTDSREWGHPAFDLAMSGDGVQWSIAREVPSMQSFLGTEPGSVGWEYFLLLPVGDAEQTPEDSMVEGVDEDVRERGGSSRSIKGGVRSVDADYVVKRLKDVGELWWTRKQTLSDLPEERDGKAMPEGLEMYTQLFSYLLYPPTRIATEDYNEPYSLKVQITSLIQTLATKQLWLDFSNVEWRIKLGQVLWGNVPVAEDYDDPDAPIPTPESEKVWLLLQILLACELVIRLDVLLSEEHPTHTHETTADMLQRFRDLGGRKVEWDILLARRWLENVKIVEKPSPPVETAKKAKSSFLAPPISSWFGSSQPEPEPESSSSPDSDESTDPVAAYDAMLVPRHQVRQIDGLLHFAQSIKWPDLETLSSTLSPRINRPSTQSAVSSMQGTPLSVASGSSSSYFPPARPKRLQELARKRSSMLTLPQVTGSGGWLSRSYLTGLLLPGEGLPHFLISTLLENDAAAVEQLGFNANLYGGFLYRDRSWWSRYCVVARVLADLPSSAEGAGWVAVDLPVEVSPADSSADSSASPAAVPTSWVDVATLPSSDPTRASKPHSVAAHSDARGRRHRKSSSPLMSTDLTMPRDPPRPSTNSPPRVIAKTLLFAPTASPSPSSYPGDDNNDDDEMLAGQGFSSYDAAVRFLTPSLSALTTKEVTFALRHDVSFIAAFPCLAPKRTSEHRHPLHASYVHRVVPLESLVGEQEATGAAEESDEVRIVETWTKDEAVFVKAWCAQRGFSAVVGRRGRTCLACCIREASALGVRVVVRV